MSRPLRRGVPRVFRSHAGERGHWFRSQYRALEERLGPFDGLTRQFAASCSALYVEWRSDVRAEEEADRARREGKGRRPSAAVLARLKKRAGLSWQSYDGSLRRLEELAGRKPAQTPLAALAAGAKR